MRCTYARNKLELCPSRFLQTDTSIAATRLPSLFFAIEQVIGKRTFFIGTTYPIHTDMRLHPGGQLSTKYSSHRLSLTPTVVPQAPRTLVQIVSPNDRCSMCIGNDTRDLLVRYATSLFVDNAWPHLTLQVSTPLLRSHWPRWYRRFVVTKRTQVINHVQLAH